MILFKSTVNQFERCKQCKQQCIAWCYLHLWWYFCHHRHHLQDWSPSVKWQLLWIYNGMARPLPGMEASGSFLWKLWSVKWWWAASLSMVVMMIRMMMNEEEMSTSFHKICTFSDSKRAKGNDRSQGCISLGSIMQDGAIMQMQNLIGKNNANAKSHWE